MNDKHLQKIDQAIAKIAGFAHMNIEEAREFIYLYLERQLNGQNHKEFDDENMEAVFTNAAQELKIPIDELKIKIYNILKQTKSSQ